MNQSLPPYQLSVDGFAGSFFQVHALKGKEAISEPWDFDIVVTCEPGDEAVERTALGQRAVLRFEITGTTRAFHGVIAAVRHVEVHAVDHAVRLHLRLVPRLWLLKRKQRTRIFQGLRVPDIVAAVLAEAGIGVRFQLTRGYPMREYVTQYEESDYRFVTRLLAEAGIFYYFPEGPPVEGAALAADQALGAAAAAGTALFGASPFVAFAGEAASLASPLIPGDTVICADDATAYPPLNGDDAGALAAATAAALAPAAGDAFGLGEGTLGAVTGTASALAGTAIAAAVSAAADVPSLHFLHNALLRESFFDKVTKFTLRNTVRSTGGVFRDYDPDRPLVRLQSASVSTAPFPPSPFEAAAMALAEAENAASAVQTVLPVPVPVAEVAALADTVAETAETAVNAVAGALGQKVPHEVYEHHSPFLFPKWGFANDEAPRILRQKRRRASIAQAEGGCSDLSAGHRFILREHPASQLDGGWVVTRVEHRGEARPQGESNGRVYWATFECAPVEMPYPPPRPKRRSVQVSLTATVVGPPGEEIWVDDKGQIKVQFHWDREGQLDDRSSCWIRVMQPWAGPGWGHQFIPRVGMEVVVVFEGGDPDKPMVMGTLYNGTHPPPFKLPGDKAKSGIRTSTYPGGQGHNELSFDDRSGHEEVYVHAQRDYHEVVENNHTADVHGAKQTTVDRDAKELIKGSAHLHVEGEREGEIGKDDRLHVKGNLSREVGLDRRDTVWGTASLVVHKAHSMEARGGHTLVVGTPAELTSCDQVVFGTASVSASKQVVLHAEEGLRILCGDSMIELLPDKIVLKTATLELKADKSISASSKQDGPSLSLGDEVEVLAKGIRIFSEGGALELDKDAKIAGKSIKLGYDPSKPEKKAEDKDPETKPLDVKLSDYWMEPYAGKHYHLMVNGLRFEGDTGGGGEIKQDIPKDATQASIRLWLDDYPEGRQQLYTLRLQKEIPPATTIYGAKVRLKNLGYFTGELSESADGAFRAAVLEFQTDHQDSHALTPTGQYDDATRGALEEIHGS